jgi:chorismate mutase
MAATMTTEQTDRDLADSSIDAADTIDLLRGRIDGLDEAITRLVAERAAVSAQIQEVRVGAGGTRMELSRERVVLDHYRRELGARGAALGEAVLRVCRGER